MIRSALARSCVLIAALGSVGCAPRPPQPAKPPSGFFVDARRAGFELEDPMALDPAILADVDRHGRSEGSPEERLGYLVRYLAFRYEPNQTLSARRAYYARKGDCMSFALLVAALARHMGLAAYFVHVREVQSRFERSGWFYVSSHVALGLGTGPSALVADFLQDRGGVDATDWRLAQYDAIDDTTAMALYYSNIAVADLVAGHTEKSARLLRFLLRERPIEELYANLGVALSREGKYAESLQILEDGIRRFPTYAPLYTNALNAAASAKRPDLVETISLAGEQIAQQDPFFLFARALSFYQGGSYGLAARELERAARSRPASPVVLAWLTRAYMSVGDLPHAIDAFGRMRRADPETRLAQELTAQFPELRAAL